MEKPKTTLSAQDLVILFCVAIEIGDSHLKDGKLSAEAGLFYTRISVTLEPITSEQATNGQWLLLIPERASK